MTDDRATGRDYGVLFFLMFISVMNFVDRQLLASFANYIVPQLKLADWEYGILAGFGFTVIYSIMGLFAGTLADKLHRPRFLALGLALWSALTAVSGAARGFYTLLIPRMFIGVGESVATPTSMSILGDRFPARMLGFAAGFYYMGVPVGVGASLLIAGYLGPAIGWRNCFYLLGVIGLVAAAGLLLLRETPRKGVKQDAAGVVEERSFGEVMAILWKALTSSPALVCTMAGGVGFHFILGAAAFDQLWFVHERGFDKDEILILSGYIGMAGGILGTLLGGFLGDKWQELTKSGRPMFLFWALLVLTPFNMAYRLVPPDSIFFWLGIFLGFMQLGLFYGPTFATVQELVPARIRATVVAFYIILLNIIGLGVGGTGAGITVEILKALEIAEPYTKTLFVFTILSALAIPLMYIAGKRFHADKARLDKIEV